MADCAVIGVYVEEQATELPRAYVVPQKLSISASAKDKEAFSKKVEEWVKERVANHKRLRGGVILVESIPKSWVEALRDAVKSIGRHRKNVNRKADGRRPSGKILRKDLRLALKKEIEQQKAQKTAKAKL